MSLLNFEWNLDDAIKVRVEEKAEDIAKEMLLENEPISKIIKLRSITKSLIFNLRPIRR